MSRSIMSRVIERDSSGSELLGRYCVEHDVKPSVRMRPDEERIVESHLADEPGKRPQMLGPVVRAKREPRSAARDQPPRPFDRLGLRTLDVHLEVGSHERGKDVVDRDCLHYRFASRREMAGLAFPGGESKLLRRTP